MRWTPARIGIVGVGVMSAALVLGGCTSADDAEIPTLAKSSVAEETRSQEQRDRDLVACLVSEEIPAKYGVALEGEDGPKTVVFDTDKAGLRCDDYTCVLFGDNNPDVLEPLRETWDALLAKHGVVNLNEGGKFADALVIDDQDFTEPYVKCLADTDYSNPTYVAEMEAPQYAADDLIGWAEATNEWTACARENGVPTVKDVKVPTEGNDEGPEYTLLSSTMTEAQVRELMTACPEFDQDAVEKAQALKAKGEIPRSEYAPYSPQIGFDTPGWDGTLEPAEGMDPKETERLDRLRDTVGEARNKYWADYDRDKDPRRG
jgi:hypothetical protein